MDTRGRLITHGTRLLNRTTEDIAGLLGLVLSGRDDVKDLERALMDIGLRPRWTSRSGVRVKAWYSPRHATGRPRTRAERVSKPYREPPDESILSALESYEVAGRTTREVAILIGMPSVGRRGYKDHSANRYKLINALESMGYGLVHMDGQRVWRRATEAR